MTNFCDTACLREAALVDTFTGLKVSSLLYSQPLESSYIHSFRIVYALNAENPTIPYIVCYPRVNSAQNGFSLLKWSSVHICDLQSPH